MGKESKKSISGRLERQMLQISQARVNDAVKLAFLSNEDRDLIDQMDLTALTEFKRGSNGVVEVKFADRMGTIEKLMELYREDPTEKLLRQLGGGEDE